MTEANKQVTLVVTGKSHTRSELSGNKVDGFKRVHKTYAKGEEFSGTEVELEKFRGRLALAGEPPAPADPEGPDDADLNDAAPAKKAPAKQAARAKK